MTYIARIQKWKIWQILNSTFYFLLVGKPAEVCGVIGSENKTLLKEGGVTKSQDTMKSVRIIAMNLHIAEKECTSLAAIEGLQIPQEQS